MGCAAVAALVLTTAGCGGGSGDDSAASSPSKAEFIKKADAICSQAAKQTAAEFAAYAKKNQLSEGQKLKPSQYAEIGETILIPALKRQIAEIEALGAPEGDEDVITSFIAAVNEAIQKAEAEPKAAQSPEKLLAKADKLVANYGFKVCGQR